MATRIPYLDEVWSVTTGCGDDMVSPGCRNCYARRMFGRNLWKCPTCGGSGTIEMGYRGSAASSRAMSCEGEYFSCGRCRGKGAQIFTPTFHADRLDQPLHWRKPRVVGVSFMGDLFHEAITDEQIHHIWWQFDKCPQHTFLILTKRPQRMREWWEKWWGVTEPNLWLGVTVCNQAEADRNIPILLDTPAAVRWVSIEPMLGAVSGWVDDYARVVGRLRSGEWHWPDLNWVVLGGETGPGARLMEWQWALDVFDQCRAAGVPFYWKQSGDWLKRSDREMSDEVAARVFEMAATRELPAAGP